MIGSLVLAIAVAQPPSIAVRVDGSGFLTFVQSGHAIYLRSATIQVVDGRLAHESGAVLLPTVLVPVNTRTIEIDDSGVVHVRAANYRARAGRIEIALFDTGTEMASWNGYLVSGDRPSYFEPGTFGAGTLIVERRARTKQQAASQAGLGATAIAPLFGGSLEEENFSELQRGYGRSRIEIEVLPQSLASGEKVLLGDVARISGDEPAAEALRNVIIADAPVYGSRRRLMRADIVRRLSAAGIPTAGLSIVVPNRAYVRRLSQDVSAADVARIATEAVEQSTGKQAVIDESQPCEDIAAPIGQIELVAESCTSTETGATVIVVAKVNGQRYLSRVVRLTHLN